MLPSPFDWEKQALLYLSPTPDPRDPTFGAAAVEEVVALALASGGGAFVLATSRRAMLEMSRASRARLEAAGLPVLVQGDKPKSELLDRFRASGTCVLFATQSFWEGVDVPGHALRLVIIDRLPFDVPTDPLVAARTQRLEEEGRAPFMEYHVPAAALGLKQAFGRLVRTETDRGVVTILDGRITQKGYGRIFLQTLPPARVTNERAVAIEMLEELRRAPGT
jgi:ATP-dependent DNA helicase DinG